ncbi:hypothetical protein LAD67_08460 [Escherichia coli]|nr:hypothetical protein [Escherichia coli]
MGMRIARRLTVVINGVTVWRKRYFVDGTAGASVFAVDVTTGCGDGQYVFVPSLALNDVSGLPQPAKLTHPVSGREVSAGRGSIT